MSSMHAAALAMSSKQGLPNATSRMCVCSIHSASAGRGRARPTCQEDEHGRGEAGGDGCGGVPVLGHGHVAHRIAHAVSPGQHRSAQQRQGDA